MIGFEPGSSRIVSDRSANCATTNSQFLSFLLFVYSSLLNRQLDNISNTHIISHIPTWVHRYYIISITTFVYIFHNVHFILTFSRYTLLIGTYLLYFYFYFFKRPILAFSSFPHDSIHIWTDTSVDGALVTRTQGGRMEGTDESTEQWEHPNMFTFIDPRPL